MTSSLSAPQQESHPEAEAIVAIVSGSNVAEHWRLLWESHAKTCHRIALRILRDETEAWSAVNDAWCKAYEQLSLDINSFASWVATLTRNQAIDVLRSKRRQLSREATLEPWHYSVAADCSTPDSRARLQEIIKAIEENDKLTSEERSAFLLRILGEKTYDEIAQITGRPSGTIASDIHRAKKKLSALPTIKGLLLPVATLLLWLLGCGGAI